MSKRLVAGALGALMMITAAGSAFAAAGDFLVRGRVIGVFPDESAKVTPLGGSVKIDNAVMPEVDFSYFLTNRIAVELIAATTEHKVKATAGGGIPLGSVWLLPPTLTAQYHFVNQSKFTPYVGFGVNYTHFYDVNAPAGLSVHYQNHWGYAVQAGFDYKLGGRWSFNFDMKKLFLSTNASINGGAIRAAVDIDPWIVGTGIGYRF
jgi:outer membrane protein